MQQFDIPIIHKAYELYLALHELERTIPKMDRFTVWQRCENALLKILEGLIHVSYNPPDSRLQKLTQVSADVDMLRVFLRLSFDIKTITNKKYITLQEHLDEIGRMLGGWMKSMRQK